MQCWRKIAIEPDLDVLGDPTLVRVVLENLPGNACKYTAKSRDAHIRFGRDLQKTGVVFSVRDNAAGFDMRFADRLFGVLQRLHSATDFQGTGVGLASVRRIIRRMAATSGPRRNWAAARSLRSGAKPLSASATGHWN